MALARGRRLLRLDVLHCRGDRLAQDTPQLLVHAFHVLLGAQGSGQRVRQICPWEKGCCQIDRVQNPETKKPNCFSENF